MAGGCETNESPQRSENSERPAVQRTWLLGKLFVVFAVIIGLGYLAIGVVVRSSSDSTLRKAARTMLKGDPVAASNSLKWLLWFDSQNPEVLHLAGMSALKQKDWSAAKNYLEDIREDSPVHENAQSLLASALLADHQFEIAGEVLQRHLIRHPTSAIACRQLSGLWLTELRSRDAIGVLEDFLRQMLSEPIVLSDLLLLLRDLGVAEFRPPGPQDCLETLRLALEHHPKQSEVHLALANCYVRLGKLQDAERPLQEALAFGSRTSEFRMIDCEFWLANGNPDRAEIALQGSNAQTETTPAEDFESDDRVWELRCRISENRGDNQRALREIDHALSLRPFTKEYESRRARLLQKLQRTEEARRAYERSHEFGKSELELWRLTRDFDLRTPTSAECEHVAGVYESLGKSLQADAWRRLSELVGRDAAAN